MDTAYTPPFTITPEITNLVIHIGELIGHLTATTANIPSPKLRKQNRIKTIQSSLAIENNSLSIEQVTAILEGKRVLGSPNEIQEVKNAIDAYELLLELNPYKEKDLLRAHRLMMHNLVRENGHYRSGGVGVIGQEGLVHVAPPANRVPMLMGQLMEWVKKSQEHPLVRSCVFHYEFEFIHPFADGNGRMGRMWQTLLLMQWNPIFAWIPVESIVKDNQQQYYDAIAQSDHQGNSTPFIRFMLQSISLTLEEIKQNQQHEAATEGSTLKSTPKSTLKGTPKCIYDIMSDNPTITINELSERLALNRRGIVKHIQNLQSQGLIHRIGPAKGGHWEVAR